MIVDKLLKRLFAAMSARAALHRRPRVIFIGDSITEFWSAADPWPFRPIALNKGISGQTTEQMRARFAFDVVRHRPKVVHIMGGTNDLWFGHPGEGATATLANIAVMAEMARAAGIAVILAPPPPIAKWAEHHFAHLDCLPALLDGVRALAGGYFLIDYADVLLRDGVLYAPFTTDGVHLSRAGYRAMRSSVDMAIGKVLRASQTAEKP